MAISTLEHALELQTEFENSALPDNGFEDRLQKQILVQGKSWQTPSRGDEVEVHFSGQTKEGTRLDSSWDRGTPFKFKLGQCEVIKGWDDGVATMRKGERAIFTIPPNLAYGEVGSPPLIAPNSTLVFDIKLITWHTIRDITGDGGVLKKIIREGEGWATPRDGDEVLVKYNVTLENGTLVSKSECHEFFINENYKCPAISRAVKTMRRGEKVELAVKFSYGNKEFVTESSVLPASNLTIKLELLSWKTVVYITEDRKVVKKILNPGEGFDHPSDGSLVKVTYVCKLEDGSVIERKGSEEEPYEFLCLEEQVNDGLDRTILTMKKGEQALVTIGSEYLSSCDVSKMNSSGSAMQYEVRLINFAKEKPYWKMETCEKIEACERKKRRGNNLFKAGKFWHASMKYEKEINSNIYFAAAKYVEFDHSFTDNDRRVAESLRLSCLLNNAACKLRLEQCLEASRLCTKVLEVDPFNIKALFRRSQAYLKISELEKAEEDIKRALAIDPQNRDLKLAQKELKGRQKEYVKYQSEIFSSMLAKMAN